MKRTLRHLILLSTICFTVYAEDQGARPTVSPFYTLAGLQRTHAIALASYTVETRALPETPEGSKKNLELWEQFEAKAAELFLKVVELAKDNPRSEHGFAALEWVLKENMSYDLAAGAQAFELMMQQYSNHPNVGYAVANLAYYLPDESTPSRQAAVDLLHAVAERNPDRTARGQALLGLAGISKEEFLRAEETEHPDINRLAEQAIERFELVLRDYGNCLYLRTCGFRPAKVTLGEEAKLGLFELRRLRKGEVAPDISGVDLSGVEFGLSDYRGKVVLLVFWASWCGPCMADVPHEKELVERFSGRPFVLIGVNGDPVKARAAEAVAKQSIPWRSFWDGGDQGKISVAWNVRRWPSVYVLDHKGVIQHTDLRGERLDDPLEHLVKAAE